jgi:26S proteasome regulatory subunit N8
MKRASKVKANTLLLSTVPFEEDEKDPSVWFLDHNYVESMNDMFKKVNAREKLIGWYHSGPKLRASDLEINELFKRYAPNPLLVIIDVQPRDVGVPTDAYFAVEEIKDVRLLHSFIAFASAWLLYLCCLTRD